MRKNIQLKSLKKHAYIDILRGIAIIGVIAVHTQQNINGLNKYVSYLFNYGQLGVQLFFVASAITLCLSSEQRNEYEPYNFYIRRFFRIAPLFYFAILFYLIWRIFLSYLNENVRLIPDGYNIYSILETIFFVNQFDPRNSNYVVPGGWSISVEISFYVMFPFLFHWQSKLKTSVFLYFTLAIFFICLLIKNIVIYLIQPILIEKGIIHKFTLEYNFLTTSIINQICVFLIGILTYRHIYVDSHNKHYQYLYLLPILPLNYISCFLLNSKSYTHTPLTGLLYPVISALSFSFLSIYLSKLKEFKYKFFHIMIKFGQLSFSMYILHFFILDMYTYFLQKYIFESVKQPEIQLIYLYLLVLLTTFIFSIFTYNIIEKPGIKFGKKLLT